MLNSTDKLFVLNSGGPLTMDRRWKTNIEVAPNCPRCASTNTKFCYYNNYSLSQPRYFCKGCRRYWTKGGTLRNVPFGGGCRKHRRGKLARTASPTRSPNSDRVGSSYSSSSQPSSDGSLDDGKSGSDIDLALVFSKFLNPESGSDSGFVAPEITHPPIMPENIGGGTQEPEYRGLFGPEFERIAEFMDTGLEMEQVQPLLISDGVSQDMLWTEEDPGLSNFSWEEEQVHGFDGVMDDHSMFHRINNNNTNNISSSSIWNSFDIQSFGT